MKFAYWPSACATIYYASMAQIYCKQLIEYMNTLHSRPENGPPYVITKAHVEEAFAGESMRKLLVERLQMTLQLDKRYRLIALIFTQRAIEDRREPRGERRVVGADKGHHIAKRHRYVTWKRGIDVADEGKILGIIERKAISPFRLGEMAVDDASLFAGNGIEEARPAIGRYPGVEQFAEKPASK